MELKDFIKTALLEITEAVFEASNESLVSIAPIGISLPDLNTIISEHQLVEFDLAVTETNKDSSNKEGKKFSISVLGSEVSLEGKVGKNSESVQQSVNRIKFSVPVYFQFTPKKYDTP